MKYLWLLTLFATYLLVSAQIPKVTNKVILDIELEGVKLGKIEIGLFKQIVPKTVKNFIKLCERPFGKGYKGCKYFKVIRGEAIQTGLFAGKDGSTGLSYYNTYFDRENFDLKHYGAGWVSMANTEKDFVNTQFFITLKKKESLDGLNVVFGKVIKGMDVVWEMANLEVDKNKKPIKDVVIADCTVEKVKKSFIVETTDATE